MARARKSDWVLTGRHVIFICIGIFTVVGGVNAYMVMQSVKTFRGEDVKGSYRQGLAYNETLDKRTAQRASGWEADISIANDNTLTLSIVDSGNIAVRGLTVTGLLKHPIDTDFDLPVTFANQSDGTYIANVDSTMAGKRWLITKAVTTDGFIFETRNEIWLK